MTEHRSLSSGGFLGLGFALAVFFALALVNIRDGAPLGHDEAVYALRAAWASGDQSVNLFGYWVDYRAPGLPWVLSFVWLVRSTEPYLRLVISLFGAAGVILTWWMARDLFGRRAAVMAATGLAVSPWWIVPSARVWPDVPGATLGLATLAVLVWATGRPRVSWWAVLAAPLAVATTVVRFGAPLSLLVGAGALCWWRWEVVRKSIPVVAITGILAGMGTWMVLFTTLISDGDETPYQAVSRLQSGKSRSIWDGFAGYRELVEFEFATPIAVALFAGVAAAFVIGGGTARKRPLVFVSVTAVLSFVILAASLHAELRYLAPVLPFAWMFAGFGLSELSGQLTREVLIPVALVVMIPFVFGTAADSKEDNQVLRDRFAVLKEAMQQMDWPAECRIASSFSPQVGWYSGCRVVGLESDDDPVPTGSVTHIVDVFGSNKEPPALESWLIDHAVEVAEYGDPGFGEMRAVRILVPIE